MRDAIVHAGTRAAFERTLAGIEVVSWLVGPAILFAVLSYC
jgi:hypothetical protein